MTVDDDTLCLCFVFTLRSAGYALEIGDLNLKRVYDRKETVDLVRNQCETLNPSLARGHKGNNLALVSKGGRRKWWLRGIGGRSGKVKEDGGAGDKKGPAKCWRYRAIDTEGGSRRLCRRNDGALNGEAKALR